MGLHSTPLLAKLQVNAACVVHMPFPGTAAAAAVPAHAAYDALAAAALPMPALADADSTAGAIALMQSMQRPQVSPHHELQSPERRQRPFLSANADALKPRAMA